MSAIIIDSSKKEQIEKKIDEVRKRHFQTGELKSKGVGNNHDRRLEILRDLSKIDFHIYCLIVDKSKVVSEGLIYRKSFYKFVHGLLYSDLFKIYPDMMLYADEVGGSQFMTGFAKYISDRHIPTLFTQSSFSFLKSNSHQLIQLADFVSGTRSRCFDSKYLSPKKDEFIKAIARKDFGHQNVAK